MVVVSTHHPNRFSPSFQNFVVLDNIYYFSHPAGVGSVGGQANSGLSGMPSDYVRKELKAVVGARTIQRGMSSGAVINLNQTLSGIDMMNRNSPPMMVPGGKPLNQADLEALGLSYELHPVITDYSEIFSSYFYGANFYFILGTDGRHWDNSNMSDLPSQGMTSNRVCYFWCFLSAIHQLL